METKVIGLLGVVFRVVLRNWAKDNTVLSDNIVDIQEFAQQCGLSIWEAKRFSRSIEDFIDVVAEDFMNEFANEIKNSERKQEILEQVIQDVKSLNVEENLLEVALLNSEELRNVIMNQSIEERKLWDDIDSGVYNRAVRYLAKVCIEFAMKLPTFTSDALKLIVRRQEEYNRELVEILSDIHNMTKLIKNVDVTYREYESFYREKIIEKYSKIELIGTGIKDRRITKYDISSAYVELNCVNDEVYDYEVELSHVFVNDSVVWIKGEAGSGKTTFLQWIAVCAAKNEYNKIENIRGTIPIIVGLRNIEWPLNLEDVVSRITKDFGTSCPEGWISKLLKENKVVLLFDGFDEISQIRRDEVYDFIEGIVEKYPKIKVLLTARNSVHDLLSCEFIEYEIVPMKMESIKTFIRYWHRAVLWRGGIVEDKIINELQENLIIKIADNQSLKSLARNPLLCAMICALNYTNNEYLPSNKMELYEKCCEMLMDARDQQREIDSSMYKNISSLDYNRKKKVLEEMAFWMMSCGDSSVTKKNAISFFKHLIRDTNIILDKEYSANELLEYFIERSGIIREPEEGQIDFIHKTFMEFLSVKAICRNCAWSILVKEACNVNWRETIIMCLHEMGKENVEEVLCRLLEAHKLKNDDKYIFIAASGAANAIFLSNNDIKNEIDKQISAMIPPNRNQVYELVHAGSYLLPFLKDSPDYSNEEKERCLFLLRYLEMEEAIPDILTYISGNGSHYVKAYALDILNEYTEIILDEYNVREALMNILIKSIKNDILITYENLINLLIYDVQFDEQIQSLTRIQQIEIICGAEEEDLYWGEYGFLRCFKNCKTVKLSGRISRIDCLKYFRNIQTLEIDACCDFTYGIQELAYYNNMTNIKILKITAEKINYICESDFANMKNLEVLEIHCLNEELEIDIDTFNNFANLKKVLFELNTFAANDICEKIRKWKSEKENCVFLCI